MAYTHEYNRYKLNPVTKEIETLFLYCSKVEPDIEPITSLGVFLEYYLHDAIFDIFESEEIEVNLHTLYVNGVCMGSIVIKDVNNLTETEWEQILQKVS